MKKRPFRFARFARFTAGGYSIVEIAVVLVVAGLLVSGAIASFDRWSRYEQTRTTRDSIELAKQAIVQYAARRGTFSMIVNVRGEVAGTVARVAWRLPPSRPYLPCPDVNGDGIEDRVSNPALFALEDHIRGEGDDPDPTQTDGNLFFGHGVCASQRGFLPWRTLRVPEADAWGGLFSYYVDAAFSHSVVGFNQSDHADQLDPRRPLDIFGDDGGERADANRVCYSADAAIPPPGQVYRCPELRPRLESIQIPTAGLAHQGPALVCDFGPCSLALKKANTTSSSGGVGAVAEDVLYRFSEGENRIFILRRLREDDIFDAPAFVVISHGANGYGGVAVRNARTDASGYVLRCAAFPDGATATDAYRAERQNAWRARALESCPSVVVEEDYRGHYTARAGGAAAAEFDDVVEWMEVDVLKSRLADLGVLPAPGLPPLGLR